MKKRNFTKEELFEIFFEIYHRTRSFNETAREYNSTGITIRKEINKYLPEFLEILKKRKKNFSKIGYISRKYYQ